MTEVTQIRIDKRQEESPAPQIVSFCADGSACKAEQLDLASSPQKELFCRLVREMIHSAAE